MKKINFKLNLIIIVFVLIVIEVSAISRTNYSLANNNNPNNWKYFAKSADARGHEWGYLDGY